MISHRAIGCTLGAISVFLLIAAISNSEWALSEGWREGLFVQCVDKGGATPLPFRQPHWMGNSSVCHPRLKTNGSSIPELDEDGEPIVDRPGYVKNTLVLVIIGLLFTLCGTVLTGMGLKTEDVEKQKNYNKYSIGIFAVAFIFLLIPAIIYPVGFNADQQEANVTYDGCMLEGIKRTCGKEVPAEWQARDTPREFSFGFCFGVLCLSVIFVLIATILCVLDHFNPEPEKEEADPEKDG